MVNDIVLVPENELDVRTVRINEFEGIIDKLVIVSADYTALVNDRFIIANEACRVTLPDVNIGKIMTVKNSSTGTVVVDGENYRIDGSTLHTITVQYEWLTMVFNGTEWSSL